MREPKLNHPHGFEPMSDVSSCMLRRSLPRSFVYALMDVPNVQVLASYGPMLENVIIMLLTSVVLIMIIRSRFPPCFDPVFFFVVVAKLLYCCLIIVFNCVV